MALIFPKSADMIVRIAGVLIGLGALTGVGAYTYFSHPLVIEIDVIWKAMNLNPWDRLTGRVTVADFAKTRTLSLHARVAIHTNFGCRNRRIGRLSHRIVTIGAIHAHVSGMKFMAVRNRLHGSVPGLNHQRMREICVRANAGQCSEAD